MTSQRTRDRLVTRLQERGIKNNEVLSVIREMPRHLFVDEALASRAYEDTALPIGHGQTISQPYIVAKMTEILLEGGPRQKILEVGTGSGYQTAVLSKLVERVYSVERISPLQNQARERFYQLKLNNIKLKDLFLIFRKINILVIILGSSVQMLHIKRKTIKTTQHK